MIPDGQKIAVIILLSGDELCESKKAVFASGGPFKPQTHSRSHFDLKT